MRKRERESVCVWEPLIHRIAIYITPLYICYSASASAISPLFILKISLFEIFGHFIRDFFSWSAIKTSRVLQLWLMTSFSNPIEILDLNCLLRTRGCCEKMVTRSPLNNYFIANRRLCRTCCEVMHLEAKSTMKDCKNAKFITLLRKTIYIKARCRTSVSTMWRSN